MTNERVRRRLTAVLAADIAGYSRLTGADKEGTLVVAIRSSYPERVGVTITSLPAGGLGAAPSPWLPRSRFIQSDRGVPV